MFVLKFLIKFFLLSKSISFCVLTFSVFFLLQNLDLLFAEHAVNKNIDKKIKKNLFTKISLNS